jgi:cell division protein FtsB
MKGLLNQIALGVFGLLAISTLLLAIFNDHGAIQVHSQSQKLTAIEAEVAKTQADNQQLNNEIHLLRTDPVTIERIAREEQKLVKPGEIVLVTPGEAPQQDH